MSKRLSNLRIVIVDDDAEVRSSIDLAMRSEGATTALIEDGNAAVHECQTNPADLVVLDMMLPRRSGFLVLEKIKQIEPPPIVIMITANEGKRHMAYAEALGADAYMQKPVPLQRLVDKAVDLIEAREDDEPS